MAKSEETPQFYTGEGVNVTVRVTKGKTKFFRTLEMAEYWANMRRSYKYEMFDSPVFGKRQLIGYGVPA